MTFGRLDQAQRHAQAIRRSPQASLDRVRYAELVAQQRETRVDAERERRRAGHDAQLRNRQQRADDLLRELFGPRVVVARARDSGRAARAGARRSTAAAARCCARCRGRSGPRCRLRARAHEPRAEAAPRARSLRDPAGARAPRPSAPRTRRHGEARRRGRPRQRARSSTRSRRAR